MENPSFVTVFTLLLITFLIGSCEGVAGFFKTTMGFGVFSVIAMFLAIAIVGVRIKKGKKMS